MHNYTTNEMLARASSEPLVAYAMLGGDDYFPAFQELAANIYSPEVLSRALFHAMNHGYTNYAEVLLAKGAKALQANLYATAYTHHDVLLLRKYGIHARTNSDIFDQVALFANSGSPKIYGLLVETATTSGEISPSLIHQHLELNCSGETEEEKIASKLALLVNLRNHFVDELDDFIREKVSSVAAFRKEIEENEDMHALTASIIILDSEIKKFNPLDRGAIDYALTLSEADLDFRIPSTLSAFILMQPITINGKIYHCNIWELSKPISEIINDLREITSEPILGTDEPLYLLKGISLFNWSLDSLEQAHTEATLLFPASRGELSVAIRAKRVEKKLSIRELAVKTGCYVNHITGFENGLLVPGERNLLAICTALEMNYTECAVMAERDKAKLEALFTDKRQINIIRAMSNININSKLHADFFEHFLFYKPYDKEQTPLPEHYRPRDIIENIQAGEDSPYRIQSDLMTFLTFNRTNESGIKDETVKHTDLISAATAKLLEASPAHAKLCAETIKDMVLDNIPKRNVDEILDSYLESLGEATPNFYMFLAYWAEDWQVSQAEHARILDYGAYLIQRSQSLSTKSTTVNTEAWVTAILDKSGEITGVKPSKETYRKLTQIKHGQDIEITPEHYLDAAFEIFSATEPKIGDFKSNLIVQFMLNPELDYPKEDDAVINKAKVTNALLFCLLAHKGFTTFLQEHGMYHLMAKNKAEHAPTAEDYRNGRLHLAVECDENGKLSYDLRRGTLAPNIAKALAPGNIPRQEKITAALLAQPMYYKPSSVVDLVDAGKMTIFYGIKILRMQKGLDRAQLADHAGCSKNVLINTENGCFPKSVEEADNISFGLCTLYSLPQCRERLKGSILGKVAALSLREAELVIRAAYKAEKEKNLPGYNPEVQNKNLRTSYQLFLMLVEVTSGPNKLSDFLEKVTYTNKRGETKSKVSPGTASSWKAGSLPSKGLARGVAERAKLSSEVTEMFIELATNTVMPDNTILSQTEAPGTSALNAALDSEAERSTA